MSDWSSTRIELGRASPAGDFAGASSTISPTINLQIRQSMTNTNGLGLPGEASICVCKRDPPRKAQMVTYRPTTKRQNLVPRHDEALPFRTMSAEPMVRQAALVVKKARAEGYRRIRSGRLTG